MKKEIRTKGAIFPMPVLLIGTYNEDDTVDVMNAAWGTLVDSDIILLSLAEDHKTVENINNKKGFTVSLTNVKYIKEADFFGIVSGNNIKNKFELSKLTSTKSSLVDAPIINELPLCMECELLKADYGEYGLLVYGKIVKTSADEEVLTNDNVDITKLNTICYDSFTHGYYKIGERVGNAFKDGLELKK